MTHGISIPVSRAAVSARDRVATGAGRIPWYVWCCVAATVSAMIGGIWDISWHKTIGRDTFWTPAHMLIYLCGVMTGAGRSEEHTSELQSRFGISHAVF